ncbi:MAG: restriction endonuclease subunit S [Oscillospiraceae bacterium]|nr:restriction endonuclease subunit S [Oscillospiraceae bacterium]
MTKKASTPALRFKGFTYTWEQRKLSDMCSLITKGTTPLDKSNSGTVNFIKIESIDESSGEIKITQKITAEEHNGYLRRSQLKENDILFSIAGTLGRVTSVKSDILPANTNQALAILRLKNGSLPYIKTYLKGKVVADFIKKNPTIGAQPNLSLEQVGNLEIALLTDKEQECIGQYFTNLDHLITLHQRKYDKLTNMKKSMLEKMFPKNGANVPEIRFKGFTDAWEQRKLGDIVDVCSGRDYKHLADGNIPVYGTGGYMLSVNEALSIDKDAIGIGRKGTIDKPYILNAPFWTVDTLFYCVPKEKVDLDFAFDIFLNVDWKKKDESTGVPSLSKAAINEIDILVPTYREQRTLGQYFTNLDHLITLHYRELEKLKNLKKACLEKMFV